MTNIKNLAITKTVASASDYLVLQDPTTNQTYKITRSNFLSGISASSVSALWTPSQISTANWLDANDPNSVLKDSSSKISALFDKSGNGRHFTMTSPSPQPTANFVNARQVAVFDGVDDYLRASSFNYGNIVSLFFVVKYNSSNRIALFDGNPSGQNGIRNYVSNSGVATGNLIEIWSRTPELAINCAVGSFEILNFNFEVNPSRKISKYINGGSYTEVTNASTVSISWSNLTLGSINTSASLFSGSIGEFILLTSIPSTEIRQKIEGYLAHKWGLTGNLDSSHPYKNIAPTI